MNILYSYPIIIPFSNGECSHMEMKAIWSILIVTSVIWLLLFVAALIHNKIKNSHNEYNESIWDRPYFSIASICCTCMYAVFLFIGLCCWVFTLL